MTTATANDLIRRTSLLASLVLSLLPEDFPWTEAEAQKVDRLARLLNTPAAEARRVLVFFLVFIGAYPKEVSVAAVPHLLAQFPVKWGYKKKRHDVLRLLQEMDFIFVQTDYWAKIRAKRYGVGKAGRELLARVLSRVFHTDLRPRADS